VFSVRESFVIVCLIVTRRARPVRIRIFPHLARCI
jgi:hypothetical protein